MMNDLAEGFLQLGRDGRAVMSEDPPGVNGTTTVTGLFGILRWRTRRGRERERLPGRMKCVQGSRFSPLSFRKVFVSAAMLLGAIGVGRRRSPRPGRRTLGAFEARDHRQDRTMSAIPAQRHGVVQHADRPALRALVLERHVGGPQQTALLIAAGLEERQEPRRAAGRHAGPSPM